MSARPGKPRDANTVSTSTAVPRSRISDWTDEHRLVMSLLLAAAFLIFLLLRLPKIFHVPMFVDEAFHMHWLLEFAQGRFVTPVRDGKFLYILMIYPSVWFSQPLVVARIVSLIVGFVGVGAIYAAGREAFDDVTAVFAALLYALSPILVLHDIMIMQEGLVALFGSLILWASVRHARSPSLSSSLALNLFLAGGMLAKLPALYYCALPAMALVCTGARGRVRDWLRRLALFAWIPVCTLVVLVSLGWGATQKDKVITGDYFHTFLMVGHWVVTYLTWPSALILVVSLVAALVRRQWLIVSLFVYSALPILIWPAAFSPLYPRYFILTLPFMLLCIGWTLSLCIAGLRRSGGVLALVVILPLLWSDFWLWSDWGGRRMPEMDKWQYGTGWPAGYGFDEAVELLQRVNSGPYLVAGDITTMMRLDWLLRDSRATTLWVNTGVPVEWDKIKPADSRPSFLVFNEELISEKLRSETLEHARLIAIFVRPGGKSRVLVYRLL